MVWLGLLIPIVTIAFLLLFFRKKIVYWEILLLIVPSALIMLLMNCIMISSLQSDTEYLGAYISKVKYYQQWNERVSCRHPIYCTKNYPCGSGKNRHTCTSTYVCGHHHLYDVDYHPEHWTKADNYGNEYSISNSEFLVLQKRFATAPYFVDLKRNYHTIDGDAYYTDWNKLPETSENITKENSYKNKIRASHSIFKFEDIDEKEKKAWGLCDYPAVSNYNQSCVIGKKLDIITERKLQHINGFYGVGNQFRTYILFFKNQSIEAAFKQRSYWEGGNKNEMVICVGTDAVGNYQWVKAFSWMDKPELEVRIESWFNDNCTKTVDLNKFADWLPDNVQKHWRRRSFKDFEYLNVEITPNQLTWILIIVTIYNILISIWVVKNEFEHEEDDK